MEGSLSSGPRYGEVQFGLFTLTPAPGPAAACVSLHGTPTPTSSPWLCWMTQSVCIMPTGARGTLGGLCLLGLCLSVPTSFSSSGAWGVLQFWARSDGSFQNWGQGGPTTGCILFPNPAFILSSVPPYPQALDDLLSSLDVCPQLHSGPLYLSVPALTLSLPISPQHYSPLPEAPAAAQCGGPGLEAPQCLCLGCGLPELHSHLDSGSHVLVYPVSPSSLLPWPETVSWWGGLGGKVLCPHSASHGYGRSRPKARVEVLRSNNLEKGQK